MAGQKKDLTYEVDSDAFLRGLQQAMIKLEIKSANDLNRVGIRVQNAAREYCPVDTGRLRSSINSVPGEDSIGPYCDVGTNVRYAPSVEYGSAPHRIEPTKAHGLLGGKGFGPVRGGVDHPGTSAQPFMRPALAEAYGYFAGEFA